MYKYNTYNYTTVHSTMENSENQPAKRNAKKGFEYEWHETCVSYDTEKEELFTLYRIKESHFL